MKKTKSNNRLILLLVFITGACVLIVEVLATRILAPFFGNTIFSVSSILAVILGALSIGYYYGGKLADKEPSLFAFYRIILISGLSILFIRLLSDLVLPLLSATLSIFTGPLITSVLLFFIPCMFLGMLSPFAIRISMNGEKAENAGSISGKIFFFSTAGSILGSLVAGFYLIPNFGVRSILLGVSIVLLSIGFIGIIKSKGKVSPILIFTFLALLASVFIPHFTYSGIILNKDGVYQNITILERKGDEKTTRYLLQDRNPSAAMYLESDEHVFKYTKYYSLYKVYSPNPKRILVLGGGAYTVPKSYLESEKDALVDVAEIEPDLYKIAQQYFGINKSERLNNYVADGRRFLTDTNSTYDVIFSDVYSSLSSAPHQFSTVEFYRLAKDKLSDNGVLIANIIGDYRLSDKNFIASQLRTIREVFTSVNLFAVEDVNSNKIQNFIFVGYKYPQMELSKLNLSKFEDDTLKNLETHEVDLAGVDLSNQIVFTDDFAPTEKLIGETFLRSVN